MGNLTSFLLYFDLGSSWWPIRILVVVAVVILLFGLIKRKPRCVFIFGLLVLLAAVPIGFTLTALLNFGSSGNGFNRLGIFVGLGMATIGMAIMANSKKKVTKSRFLVLGWSGCC